MNGPGRWKKNTVCPFSPLPAEYWTAGKSRKRWSHAHTHTHVSNGLALSVAQHHFPNSGPNIVRKKFKKEKLPAVYPSHLEKASGMVGIPRTWVPDEMDHRTTRTLLLIYN